MPDSSDRIRATHIQAMNYMLFILNSFDENANVTKHPKMMVIFNDVSLQEKYQGIEAKK